MQPLRSGRFFHGWVCFTLFLLVLTWTPVKLDKSKPICVEAPRVPSLSRCTSCAKGVVPNENVGSVEDSLPPSTQYCLKEFSRLEVNLTELILNMTIMNREDHLVVANLIGSEEELASRKPVEDCRESGSPNTNPVIDEDDKQCLRSKTDDSTRTCAAQLTNRIKKLVALLSTEVGKRSLPSCDDFEDYTGQDESSEGVAEVNTATKAEAAKSMPRVLRDDKIYNVTFYSADLVIQGQRISLSQSVVGYGAMPNWFSRSDCPTDPIVGGVNYSTSNYPHLHLVTDVVLTKGWSSTQPGVFHEQIQFNLSRTSGDEDLGRIGDNDKKRVATFTSAECRVVDEISFPKSYAANNKTVDKEGNKLNDSDLFRGDILNVQNEINEVDVGGVEGETESEEEVLPGCQVSADESIRLGRIYGVVPSTFVRTVLRHQTITPVYSTHSNRTLFELSRNYSLDVVEQYANSSALPSYDYALMQVNHKLGAKEWERVVELGASSSVVVSAEMGAHLLDFYKKTFTFHIRQGPVLVHLHFKDRNDFSVRIEKPLEAWEIKLHLRVLRWLPFHATFKAAEMNQFMSLRDPTHPLLNATVREAENSGSFAVKWHLAADSTDLAYLLQMGKDLVTVGFGKSEGAQESDGFLDLVANILTGSTKEEQRRGQKLISDKLSSMLKLAWERLSALSPTAPQDPTTVDEVLLAGWRVLWDILNFVGLVTEMDDGTSVDGEFLVDFDHALNLLLWLLEPAEC